MKSWSRLASTALLLGVLASPAMAQTGLPPLPNPADYGAKGYPTNSAEESQIPVPAPQRGVNLPDVPLPTEAPAGLEMNRVLEGLQRTYPEIFGDFGAGMSAETAAGVFTKVLERIPQSEIDRSPLGKISPETAEQALDILTALGASVENGELQRGQVPQGAGAYLPAGLGDVLSNLALKPEQVQQLTGILVELVPQMVSGDPDDLKRMEGPLRQRLEGLFTKQQKDAFRRAEEQMRTK